MQDSNQVHKPEIRHGTMKCTKVQQNEDVLRFGSANRHAHILRSQQLQNAVLTLTRTFLLTPLMPSNSPIIQTAPIIVCIAIANHNRTN